MNLPFLRLRREDMALRGWTVPASTAAIYPVPRLLQGEFGNEQATPTNYARKGLSM